MSMTIRSFKNIFLIPVIIFAVFFAPAPASADQAKDAAAFVQKLGERAISTLADKTVTHEQAAQTFYKILQDGFDIDLIGKFVLGPTNWKAATPEQKARYMRYFEKLVIQIYSDRFSLYSGEGFRVVDAKPEDDRDTYVTTQIIPVKAGAPPIEVDWRVRNRGGQLRINDVIVEGISMSITQRSEFSSVIQKNGGDIDKFLDALEVLVNKK